MCYEEEQGSNTASIVLTLSAVIGILSKELTKDLSSRMSHDLCLKQFLLVSRTMNLTLIAISFHACKPSSLNNH